MIDFNAMAITSITLFCLNATLVGSPQEPASRSNEQKLMVSLEQLRVAPDATNYGDAMDENIDSVCAVHAPLVQELTIEALLKMLGDKKLSDDAKFLLLTSWIRVHPEADHETFKAIVAGRGKSFYSPFVGIRLEEGDAMGPALQFDAIGFPGSTSFHGLFFAMKIEPRSGGTTKPVTSGPNRSRSFWYFKTNDMPRSKVYSVRRIERSWSAAK